VNKPNWFWDCFSLGSGSVRIFLSFFLKAFEEFGTGRHVKEVGTEE